MKICWDNLDNIRYSRKTGKFCKDRCYYVYIDKCEICEEPFLARCYSKYRYCDKECSNKSENNAMYGKKHSKEARQKMSKVKKGKKLSEETKKKQSNAKSGENNPSWKGGVYKKNIPLFNTYAHQIDYAEKVRKTEKDYLEVKCTYCGKWFIPKRSEISSRIFALNGKGTGEGRFYCSGGCKQECPIYYKQKYSAEENNTKQYSREVQPELRQLVFERDNYECQKCGTTESLHCHHKEGIRWNPLESADVDMCITYCKECHKETHQKEGCGYYELQCKETA